MSDHRSLELAGTQARPGQTPGNQVIIADFGEGTFGISVDDLLEVEQIPNVAPVPHTEDWIHGVVNLRGSILTLVDPARLLEIGHWQPTPQSRMLIVGRDDPVALAVDRLRGMRQLQEPVSPEILDQMPGRVSTYAEAIYRDGESYVTLLNVRRLLDDADQTSRRSNESIVFDGGRPPAGDVSEIERGAS